MIQSILVFVVFVGAAAYLVKVLRKEFSSKEPHCEHCGVKKVRKV